MDISQNEDAPNEVGVASETGEQDCHEMEVDIFDYLKIILKHKMAILLCSLVPAIAVGLYLSVLPTYYQRTFTYETQAQQSDMTNNVNSDVYGWNLNRKHFASLLEKFYETENIDQLLNSLSKEKFRAFGNYLRDAKSKNNLARIIEFETIPKFIDLSKVPRKNPVHIKEAMSLQASILKMRITGESKTDISAVSALIRKSFENIIITNNIKKILGQNNVDLCGELDRIDARKLELGLETQREVFLLESLKNAKLPEIADKESVSFILHDRTEYMPVNFQIHALQIKLLNYQAEILVIDKQRESIRKRLDLNDILLAKINEPISVNSKDHNIMSDIHSLLKENKIHLRGLAEKIESMAAVIKPVSTEPYTYKIDKDVCKKAGIVFAVMFTATLIAVFLFEGLKKDRTIS